MYRAVEPYRRVIEAVNGFQGARILHLGVRLDLFTRVADEGKTLLQLAHPLAQDPRALELLLNALVAMGFLSKQSDRYHATPLSQTYLARGGPKYIGSLVLYQARRWHEWEQLGEAIRTGRPVREPDLYEGDPEDLQLFIHGLHELALARGDARYLSRVLPLHHCRKLVDLGGGPGTYAAMLCRAYPKLDAVVVDRPATLKFTRRILAEFDTTGRVSTVAADILHDPIRGGPYDAALVANVLHGENEETSAQLLRKVRQLLVPGGLLIVREHCMSPDRTEPEHSAVFALALVLGTRGRTYSLGEMRGWIRAAGFLDAVEIPPQPPMTASVLLALCPGETPVAVLPQPAEAGPHPGSARLHPSPQPAATPDYGRGPWIATDDHPDAFAGGFEVWPAATPAKRRPPNDARRTKPTAPARPRVRVRARAPARPASGRTAPQTKPAAKQKLAAGSKYKSRRRS